MGGAMTRLFKLLDRRGKEQRIVMLGLDSAGKTTILYKLKMGEVVQTAPTLGFNVETVVRKNIQFSVWDVGGQDEIRSLWRHYFLNTQALIFVVDSNDINRMGEAKTELWNVLEAKELSDIPVLILANKQDLPSSLSADEISASLNANKISDHPVHVQPACATTGEGLEEGIEWLADRLKEKK